MKKNLVLLFPGQGSQYVGMDQLPKAILGDSFVNTIWEQINTHLGYDLQSLVTKGPLEELTLTQNTQPALVVTSYLYYEVLKTVLNNKSIDLVLGHSLGEYSALLCAGSFTLPDAAYITHLRGQFMQEAVAPGVGAMYAILKCPRTAITEACRLSSKTHEVVEIANDNSPEQVVISGHASACQKAVEWLQQNVKERFRAVPLQVSAPFHSSLMQPAADKLARALSDMSIIPNQIAYFSNINAHCNVVGSSSIQIKKNLIDQVCGTVQWVECIRPIPPESFMVEVGPGNVLSGLVKKIIPGCNVISMDQDQGLESIHGFLHS